MTAFTLGEATVLALGRIEPHGRARPRFPAHANPQHRSRQPVRAGSIEAGSFEEGFFAKPARGACDQMLRAARDALDTGRRLKRAARAEGRVLVGREHAVAALTAGAIRVFEELCALARLNRGRVYPSYDRLTAATALGRATVARALHLLEAAGFLVRQRRFVRVEGKGAGPRYAQTSNAYRPTLPAALPAMLRKLLPRWRGPTPMPDDALQYSADQAETVATMRAGLSCRELAQASVDGPLGRMLARLGAALDRQIACEERESHHGPEPLPTSFESRKTR